MKELPAAPPGYENLFKKLVPEAESVLRRAMLNSDDEKIAVGTAKDVLAFAGVKPKDEEAVRPILIQDSQVILLVKTAKEIKDEIGEIET